MDGLYRGERVALMTWYNSRINETIKPVAAIVSFVFFLLFTYGYLSNEEYDDEFTVTITYDCEEVLNFKNDYPDQAVKLCQQLQRRTK